MRILIAILLLTATIPAAIAVSNAQLSIAGQDDFYVQEYGQPVQVTLTYEPSANTHAVAIRHPNTQQEMIADEQRTSTCGTTCSFSFITTTQPTITVHTQEDTADASQQTHTLSIRQDNQPPRIQDITINECQDSTCPVARTASISYTLIDATSGVDTDQTTVTLGDQEVQATCEVTNQVRCEATLQAISSSGTLTISAQDKAGNHASTTRTVRFDDQAPQIQEDTLTIDGLFGDEPSNLPGGTTITLQAEVIEEEQASIRVETSWDNFTGTCRRQESLNNNFLCTVDVQLPNQRINELAAFTVSDRAQNSDTEHIRLDVRESDATAQPEFWQANTHSNIRIDPGIWRAHSLEFPVELTLTQHRQTSGISPVRITVGDCLMRGASNERRNAVVTVVNQPPPQTQGVFRIRIDNQQDIPEEGTIECVAQIYTRQGNIVYSQPEEETITIQPRFLSISTPEEQYEKALIESQQKQERLQTTAQALKTGLEFMQLVCQPPSMLKGAGGAMYSAALATALLSGGTPNEGLTQAGNSLDRSSNSLMGSFGDKCAMLSCNSNSGLYGRFLDGAYFGPLDQAGTVLETIGGVDRDQVVDPYKSVFVAASIGCIPAVSYHLNNYLAIQCTELSCLESAAQGTARVSDCRGQTKQATCEYVAGSAYFALPYTGLYDQALGNIQAMLSNPLALVGAISEGVCGLTLPGISSNYQEAIQAGEEVDEAWKESFGNMGIGVKAFCGVTQATQAFTQLNDLWIQVEQSIGNLNQLRSHTQNYCATIGSGQQRPPGFLPYRAESSCHAGFTTQEIGGEQYVGIVTQPATDDRPAQVDIRRCVSFREGIDQAPGEDLAYAQATSCVPSNDPVRGSAYEQMVDKTRECSERSTRGLQEIPVYNEYDEISQEVESTQRRLEDARGNITSTQKEIRKTQRKAQEGLQTGIESSQQQITIVEQELSDTQYMRQQLQSCGDIQGGLDLNCISQVSEQQITNEHDYSLEIQSLQNKEQELQRQKQQYEDRAEVLSNIDSGMNWEDLSEAEQKALEDGDVKELYDAVNEYKDELTRHEQRVSDITPELAEKEETQKQLKAALEYSLLAEEYTDTRRAMRRVIQSAATWGRVGQSIDHLTGSGIGDTGLGRTMQQGAEAIGELREAPLNALSNACADPQQTPSRASVINRQGQPQAMLSARAAQADSGEYLYTIEVFVRSMDRQEKATIQVGTAPEEAAKFELTNGITRTGTAPIAYTHQTLHSEVCIVFENEVRTYFGESYGAVPNSDRICAEVRT